ncbi:MAG: type II secretion system F family protein, partial [Anaerolineae bacterium]
GSALLLGGIFLVVLGLSSGGTGGLSERLRVYVGGHASEALQDAALIALRRRQLSGSFATRVLVPWLKRVGGLFGRLSPGRLRDDLAHQLAIAGNPLGLGAREFYGVRVLFSAAGFVLALQILRGGLGGPVSAPGVVAGSQPLASLSLTTLLSSVLALFLVAWAPRVWLRRKVRVRQHHIRRDLPDALDMLSVCVEAGLGFDQALQRVSDRWQTSLSAELGRVVSEMTMGVSRRKALRNLAERLDVLELSSFVAVMIQSDELGMSISQTLHSQAEQMQIERRFRAQEQARKMPIKMLFPLLLLIFPAMLAVILGPTVPVLLDLFSTLRSNVG